MSDYPLVRALLVELCGLDETDAQLPPVVIANVHRGVLRLPLLGMVPLREDYIAGVAAARDVGVGVPPFRDVLAASYQLDWVRFMQDTRVDTALEAVDYDACTVVRARATGLLRQVLDEAAHDWQAYEALTLLYYAGHGVDFGSMLAVLELSLTLSPNLHDFILGRAQAGRGLPRPVQSE